MHLPDVDSLYLHNTLDPILSLVVARYQTQGGDCGERTDPVMLAEACTRFMEVMKRLEADAERPREGGSNAATSAEDITELGEYAFGLIGELGEWLDYYGLSNLRDSLVELVAALSLWVSRHQGQLTHLDPVVDCMAQLANRATETEELKRLFLASQEFMQAIPPIISQDLDKTNPGRPWRVFNLNRAIVATRTHDTELMEQAFKLLVTNLPEDAAQFFRAGMEQMEALNYPLHVREVMERYYQQWSIKRSLH